jgi:hypothetical protein
MTNIIQFSARYARHLNISRSGESATVIILPVTAPADVTTMAAYRRAIADQMRAKGIFPDDDCFTDAESILVNRSGDA